jgi:hypothetical protein
MNTLAYKIGIGLLSLFILATLLCGCFQATNRFYADSDVIVDKRFEGRFAPQLSENDPMVRCSAMVTLERNQRYAVTVQEGEDWVKLEAVLFKAGTNLFVDISQLADSRKHNDNGGKPSLLALFRRGTEDKNHVAIRFEFVEDGVEAQLAVGASFIRAINKDPTLKLRKVDDHFAVLLDPTEKLRLFLAKTGNDPSVLVQKGRWVKTPSK